MLIMATGLSSRGCAEREAAQRAELLLELIDRARVHRVMAAVVRPRRHLVDEEPPAVGDEQLDTQHADVLQPLGHRDGEVARLLRQARRHARRHHGGLEDAVAVPILARWKRGDVAVRAPREHHRQLGLERQPLLQHARHAAEALERRQGRAPRRSPWPDPCHRSPSRLVLSSAGSADLPQRGLELGAVAHRHGTAPWRIPRPAESSSRRSDPARWPPPSPTVERVPSARAARAFPPARSRTRSSRPRTSRPARRAPARRCRPSGDAGRPRGRPGCRDPDPARRRGIPCLRARSVNIRPSWPPPSMPTVAPGRITRTPAA